MKTRRFGIFLALSIGVAFGAEPAAPVVALRVNGRAASEQPLPLWRGEPIIVEVSLRHPSPNATDPILLEPPGGDWATRVKISGVDGSGATVPLTFVLTGKASTNALALQPRSITTLLFRLAGEAAARPKPGRHHLVARLDLADGRGWRGSAVSKQLVFEIVEPPVQLAPDEFGRRQLLRLRDALLIPDLPRADIIARELWAADRARPEGWLAMALVSEAKGDGVVALSFIDTAIARAIGASDDPLAPGKPKPSPKVVPLEYIDVRRRIEKLGGG